MLLLLLRRRRLLLLLLLWWWWWCAWWPTGYGYRLKLCEGGKMSTRFRPRT